MKTEIDREIKAEMRNKIQSPLLVLNNLSRGREVPKKLMEAASKDVEALEQLVESLDQFQIVDGLDQKNRPNPHLVYFLNTWIILMPVFVSMIAIVFGYHLFILGVTGKASLSVESETVGGQLINAAPGLFFAVGGLTALILSMINSSLDIFHGKK